MVRRDGWELGVVLKEDYNPFKKEERIILHQPEDANNGLQLCNINIPEEMLIHMLSFASGKDLLNCSLVCCKWHEIVKDEQIWKMKYEREQRKKAKHLPWYVYYCFFATPYLNENLIKNGNGEDQFNNWQILRNKNDWIIENPPVGAKPLPENVPELSTSCFATSYRNCSKLQIISLDNSKLLCFILDVYKPDIYCSEWVTGRFDCNVIVTLKVELMENIVDNLNEKSVETYLNGVTEPGWQKLEILFHDYYSGVKSIVFNHSGRDRVTWGRFDMIGQYGSKMAGGVCKILFDTIEPLQE